MQQPRVKFTYRDYLLLPEQDRRELIDGELYVVPAPSFNHQDVSANLGMILREFVKSKGIGVVLWAPFDVVLSDENVVQPDILYVSNENREIITEANVSGPPDLVVEVLSPSTADRDKELKLRLYSRFGVREYWIVDPVSKSVQVLALGDEGRNAVLTYHSGSVSSAVLPDLSIEVADIFATSLPR